MNNSATSSTADPAGTLATADATGMLAAAGPYRSDGELLDAWSIDREPDALSLLVQRYAALVMSVCRRQCRNRDDADDAFQATFLSLARGAASVRRADRLGGWLHRVAYRVACRARARGLQAPASLQEDPPDPRHPLDQVSRRHQLRVLDEELAALPAHHRTVVVLHLIEGRTLAQVARQTGTTTGTVRGRLQRGKQQLRRRLRCRGVVPGAAAATLALWPTDTAMAAAAAQRFIEHFQPPAGAAPPDTSSLEPLLHNGTQAMTLYGLFGGGVAAAALLLALVMGNGEQRAADGGAAGRSTISLTGVGDAPLLAQLGGTRLLAQQATPSADPFSQPTTPSADPFSQPTTPSADPFAQGPTPASGAKPPVSGTKPDQNPFGPNTTTRRPAQANPAGPAGSRAAPTPSNPFGGAAPRGAASPAGANPFGEAPSRQTADQPTVDPFTELRAGGGAGQASRPVGGSQQAGSAASRSPLAMQITRALDQPAPIHLPSTPIAQLPEQLMRQLDGIPVLLDPRGVAMAEADGKEVQLETEQLPLRTSLRKMLQPLGLKAVVEDEGLVITADMAELARRGIGTDQWINVDQDAAERIEAALSATTSQTFVEETLGNAVRILSQSHDIPMRIDERALEELALTSDVPVNVEANNISLRAFLKLMLSDLELTYTIRGETLVLTTVDAAIEDSLVRVYWLDGTGASQFDTLIDSITTAVEPGHWQAMGGEAQITPLLLQHRAALMVSATLPVHEQVERFFEVLRENHLGVDAGFDPNALEQARELKRMQWMQWSAGQGGGMGGGDGGQGGGGGGGGGLGGGGMF